MIKPKTYKSKMDAIREHFQNSGSGGDDRWFKIEEPQQGGQIRKSVRILPPWGEGAVIEGTAFFYYTGSLHYKFSIGGRDRAIACPESVSPQRGSCPVCRFIALVKKNGDSDMIERLTKGWTTSIYPGRKYWVNLIDREDGKIKMYGGNKKFIEAILDAEGDITHPEKGRDLIFIRKGRGNNTRYSYSVGNKKYPVEFNPKELYQLDTEVMEWMPYKDMVEALKENYGEEVREVGMTFKSDKKEKVTTKKKVKKVKKEYSEDDVDIEDDGYEEDNEWEK